MMKKIKGVIFDKDGTLFDIQRSWSEWAKVFVTKFSNQHNLDTLKLAKAINFDLASDKFVRESIFVHGSVSTATCRQATCLKLTRLCFTYAHNFDEIMRI